MYVAVSRVTSPKGLRLFIDSNTGTPTNVTKNIVYREVFYNLPVTYIAFWRYSNIVNFWFFVICQIHCHCYKDIVIDKLAF